MKSIVYRDTKHCIVCGSPYVQCHHIFYGPLRKKAEEYHLTAPLCWEHHEGTAGIHGKDGATLNRILKKDGQKAFEEKIGDRDMFRREFGRSWL